MPRKIIAFGMAVLSVWTPAVSANTVMEQTVVSGGTVQMPADTIAPGQTSDSEAQAVFNASLQQAIQTQVVAQEEAAESNYDVSPLIAGIEGELSYSDSAAHMMNLYLDWVEQNPDSFSSSSMSAGTSVIAGANGAAPNPFLAAAPPQGGAGGVPGVGIGPLTGPVKPEDVQAALKKQLGTLQGQLNGFDATKTAWQTIAARAQRLLQQGAGTRAARDYANEMVAWAGRRQARVQALIDIANAAPNDVKAKIDAFNTAVLGRLMNGVAGLTAQEQALKTQIANYVGAQEGKDLLQAQLGLVQVDLAQAKQNLADAQETAKFGGIIMSDYDPAPRQTE